VAIPKELELLIEGFTAEEKSLFDNLLTKQATTARAKDPNAATLADGWLRQSDYDRRMNLSKEEVSKAKNRSKELEDWYAENEPIHRAALSRAQELETRVAEVQQQLEQSRQTRGEGADQVDAAELERRVQTEVAKLKDTYGYVTKADIAAVIKDETSKMSDEAKGFITEASKKFYEETLPATANFAADIAEICFDHKSEFGDYLDRKKLAEFMTERRIVNPKDGYAEFVKPKRDELVFKQRVEDEVKQRISGMALNGGGGAQLSTSPMGKGAVQMRVEKDNAVAGSTLAAATSQAAQELRNEGKF
jgi:hypothetical protein